MSQKRFDLRNRPTAYGMVGVAFFVAGLAFLAAGQPVWVAFFVLGVVFGVIGVGEHRKGAASTPPDDEA